MNLMINDPISSRLDFVIWLIVMLICSGIALDTKRVLAALSALVSRRPHEYSNFYVQAIRVTAAFIAVMHAVQIAVHIFRR